VGLPSEVANVASIFARTMNRRIASALGVLPLAWASLVLPASGQVLLNYRFDVGTTVPDGGELLDARTVVGDNGPIARAEVSVDLGPVSAGQGFNGDLYLALGHGDALSVLLNRPGTLNAGQPGYADSDGFALTFADDAANGDVHVYRQTLFGNATTPLAGPLTGTWQPDGRLVDPDDVVAGSPRTAGLTVLEQLPTDGEYRLLAADASLGALHTVRSWALHLQVAEDHAGPLNLFQTEVSVRDAGPRLIANAVNLGGGVGFNGPQAMTFSGNARLLGSQTLRVETATSFGGGVEESGGPARLTKTGSGTLTLSGTGTYSGGTEVAEGRLVVDNASGSATGTGEVRVKSGAEIGGGGSIAGLLVLEEGAVLSPGRSIGQLSVGSALWEAGGVFVREVDSAEGAAGESPGWDQLRITGGLTFAATEGNPFRLKLVSLQPNGQPGTVFDFDSQGVYSWTLVTTGSGIAGFSPTAVVIDSSEFVGAEAGQFQVLVQGNDLRLAYAVPEPSTMGLVALGAAWLGSRGRRLIQKNPKQHRLPVAR
jgi:autotransporter-associated beta strand protein